MVHIGNDWDEVLAEDLCSENYQALRTFLKEEYKSHTVYPSMYDIFTALKETSYAGVKVLLLGQDPYHEPNQAHGLAFSVHPGIQIPPSLQNIYKELHEDLGCRIPETGCLLPWARQGVLLLNTALTVRAGQANSHRGHGWESFTDSIIRHLNEREKPVVFLLWGGNAKQKRVLVTAPQHLVLQAAHPSPLSAYNGFFGCRHFSKTNEFLLRNGMDPIDWQL